jgi:hypothetical protein
MNPKFKYLLVSPIVLMIPFTSSLILYGDETHQVVLVANRNDPSNDGVMSNGRNQLTFNSKEEYEQYTRFATPTTDLSGCVKVAREVIVEDGRKRQEVQDFINELANL